MTEGVYIEDPSDREEVTYSWIPNGSKLSEQTES